MICPNIVNRKIVVINAKFTDCKEYEIRRIHHNRGTGQYIEDTQRIENDIPLVDTKFC